VSIVKEKLIIAIAGKCFPQLLERPLSCRMFGHVEVNGRSRSDLNRDEYIEDTETRCYGNKEIAGYDAMGMIVEEGRPSLILGSTRAGQLFDALAHSSR
jgi:hypothetical protein